MASNIQQGVPQLNSPMVLSNTGVVTQPWYLFFLNLWARTGGATNNTVIGTYSGEIRGFGGPNVPDGWVICDGSSISRAGFASLYAAIGTTWGQGDGSTTFSLPNLQGKFPLGSGVSFPLGFQGGAPSVTLSVANLAAHNHPLMDPGHIHTFTGLPHDHTLTDPGHHHTDLAPTSNVTTGTNPGGIAAGGNTGTSTIGIVATDNATAGGTIGSSVTDITMGDTGTNVPFSILNPYAAINWMIKT